MKNPHRVSQNYRSRWSELPEGEFDLHENDVVDLVHNPGIGSLIVVKEDGTRVSIAGFSGYILKPIQQAKQA